jgi:hypothetical protein
VTPLSLLLKRKSRLLRSLAKILEPLISRAYLILKFKTYGAMRSIALSRLAIFLPMMKTLFLSHLQKPRKTTNSRHYPKKDDQGGSLN